MELSVALGVGAYAEQEPEYSIREGGSTLAAKAGQQPQEMKSDFGFSG